MKIGTESYSERKQRLQSKYEALIARPNEIDPRWDNGVFNRWQQPVVTAGRVPLEWRFDFDPVANPRFLERLGVNAAFNAGAILHEGKIVLVVRIEGADRKSFFALAESETGVDHFRFQPLPLQFPTNDPAETNLYDMRLTRHEDGWIYGLFCTERQDPTAGGSLSAATANCGIVRTRNLQNWERLPDLVHPSKQQRNVVLHPEFFQGKYLLYTRPMEHFMHAGEEGSLCWALADSMMDCRIGEQSVLDRRSYHTIKEGKVGAGAPPLRTPEGWLHIAHAVRENAAGMRYVLYAFLTALDDPTRIIAQPGGYFLAPVGSERVGDVSDVVFSNGLVAREDGEVFLYYASSDTRLHVATTTLDTLLDYVLNTPADAGRTFDCTEQRIHLAKQNQSKKSNHETAHSRNSEPTLARPIKNG